MNCRNIVKNKYITCSTSSEYIRSIPNVLNIKKTADEIDLSKVATKKKSYARRWHLGYKDNFRSMLAMRTRQLLSNKIPWNWIFQLKTPIVF